jgi:hypothetical protein
MSGGESALPDRSSRPDDRKENFQENNQENINEHHGQEK